MLKLCQYQHEIHTDTQKKLQVAVTCRDKVILIFPPTIFSYGICRLIFALWHGTLQKLSNKKFKI